jgi:hypothetical protein
MSTSRVVASSPGRPAKPRTRTIPSFAPMPNGRVSAARKNVAHTNMRHHQSRRAWSLAATCKSIRNEMQELFMRDCAFSVEPLKVQGWLCWMKLHAPKVFPTIRKLTLAGPQHHKHFPYDTVGTVKRHLPLLEAVGLQCQTPMFHWISTLATSPTVHITSRWRQWEVVQALESFDARVSIMSESIIWIKEQTVVVNGKPTAVREQQAIIRLTQEADETRDDEIHWRIEMLN